MALEKSQRLEKSMPPKLEDDVPTERVHIVAPETWVRRVDEWRRKHPKLPNRSEAIRLLVDLSLQAEQGAAEDKQKSEP
jgi:Arc/MetJ-type ribon-helix-helix transcriptional regulator